MKFVKTLDMGDYFGEISLLFNMMRTASVCAIEHCDMASLSRERFQTLIDRFPKLEDEFSNAYIKEYVQKKKVNLKSTDVGDDINDSSDDFNGSDEGDDDDDDLDDGDGDEDEDEGLSGHEDRRSSGNDYEENEDDDLQLAASSTKHVEGGGEDMLQSLLEMAMNATSGNAEQR